MKFVFLTYVYTPGYATPGEWLERIAMYAGIMEQLALEHEVISITQTDYTGHYFHRGVGYHFTSYRNTLSGFSVRLNRYVVSLKADIVVVQGLHQPLKVLCLGWISGANSKMITHHHAEKPFRFVGKFLQRLADGYIGAYLFASKQIGLSWVSGGNISSPDKVHEVMEVSCDFKNVEKNTARIKTSVEGGAVFLWVGRLNENKDPLTVIKAFLEFAAARPDVRLYMIYHTAELLREVSRVLEQDDRRKQVLLVGEVAHAEMPSWFSSADFFVSGSHYEGSGTALCEAMACGCIPVVTDIPSFRMMTCDGRYGLLYKAGDSKALAERLLIAAQINKDKMGRNCMAYFDENLSFRAIAGRICQIAETLLKTQTG